MSRFFPWLASLVSLLPTCCGAAAQPLPFISGVLRGQDEPQHISVNIRGWTNLFLIVDDDGDYDHDVANWGEAKVVRQFGEEVFLDKVPPASAEQAWGRFKQDNRSTIGGPMQIGSRQFARGLGTHAASTIRFRLDGSYERFEAWVGVDASRKKGEGSIRFVVSPKAVDAAPIFDSLAELKGFDMTAARLAIEDLMRAFGAKYPRGAAYLAELQRLHKMASVASETHSGSLDEAVRQLKAAHREAMLANPLLDFDRLLVLKRTTPVPARRAMGADLGVSDLNAHTSDTIPRQGRFGDELGLLSNLRGEQRFTVVHAGHGETLIDPVLHFDATRTLFAKNGAHEKNWRLWEIGLDGSNLHQVTADDGGDIGHFDASYLPDGQIIFASTAAYQGLPCEFGSRLMTCLYRLDLQMKAARQLTFEQDSDWCPALLHNGRVMYLRWEYTDQAHANSRILFHMNPDGTDQREYRGSGSWFPGSFFYAKAIPGEPHQVIGIASGHHGTPRSGRLLIMDPSVGRKDSEGVREIPGRGKTVDPIVRDRLVDGVWPQFLMPAPLSAKYHLVSAKLTPRSLWGIYLVDIFDNITLVAEMEDAALLWPAPVVRRPAPPVIQDRIVPGTNTCTVFVADVHAGPGLEGVPRGVVKTLRVIEYYFSKRGMGGLYGTLGADGPWDIKRILGTVPVERDGSAYFEMPANTPVSVQPLNAEGEALQIERSWFVGMPGERVSCLGCHESQDAAARDRQAAAMHRNPSAIQPWHGPARGFSFVREVQPVLDRHCVPCHDGSSNAPVPALVGGVLLKDWSTQLSGHWPGGGKFTTAYWELQRYVRRPGIEGDRRMFTPMDYHLRATELGQILRKGHHGVALDPEGHERLAAWVDLNAPFYGTWGEIPQFTAGYGHLEADELRKNSARAMELRKRYVPEGPFANYETIPAADPYDRTPIKYAAEASRLSAFPECSGWPFASATASAMQRGGNGQPLTRSLDLGDGVSLELVWIPGGRFLMGSTNGLPDEMPLEPVTVRPFWTARFETSNRQFRQFDSSHMSRTEDRHGYQFGAVGYDQDAPDQPAVRVSWNGAAGFCAWLAARTGLRIMLPTEAQWEWACRAGSAQPFSFGDMSADYSAFANVGDRRLHEFAADTSLDYYAAARPMKNPNRFDDWVPRDDRFDDGGFVTMPVGRYRANAWGLHDMHGNAWEWTRSMYRPYPYRDGDGRNELAATDVDAERVARGGSWYDRPFRCTSSYRLPYRAYQRVYNVGFRVICESEVQHASAPSVLSPNSQ